MYEEDIRNLGSMFKSKREAAIKRLSAEMKKKPKMLAKELFRAPKNAWKNSFGVFRANKNMAFRLALEFYPAEPERAEEVIRNLGYSHRLSRIREFQRLKKEVDSYVVEGIGVHYQDAYSQFLSGRMESAIKKMKRLVSRGKKLKLMRQEWRNLRKELRKSGTDVKDIPGIEPYIGEGDVEGAEEVLKLVKDMHEAEERKKAEEAQESKESKKSESQGEHKIKNGKNNAGRGSHV